MRNPQFDLIRTIACLMVIFMHSPEPHVLDEDYGILFGMFNQPGVGLFFILSGALLLPVKVSYKEFLKRRFGKIAIPTVAFTFLYLLAHYFTGEIDTDQLLNSVLSIPFAPQDDGIFWFLYTLMGMYLLAPVITPFLEKATKREVQFLLLLWVITLFWPVLKLFLDVKIGSTSMLHVFSGYTGYFVLGYYLQRFPLRLHWSAIFFLLIFPFVLAYIGKIIPIGINYKIVFWYLSIFNAMLTLGCYQFIVQYTRPSFYSAKLQSLISDFSRCSFCIYLTHLFIIRRLLWPLFSILPADSFLLSREALFFRILVIFLIATLLSWFTTHLLSRLPFGSCLTGYRHE